MQIHINERKLLILITYFILLNILFVSLNVNYLRQLFGFLFLTIIPGLLILLVLKIYNIELMESVLLIFCSSISFLLLFGLSFNQLMANSGYNRPFSSFALLLSLSAIYLIIIYLIYRYNNTFHEFSIDLTYKTNEKIILALSLLLLSLSIFGVYQMNQYSNNKIILLSISILCIIIYSISIAGDNARRLYPFIIYFISISLLLLSALRFNHIYGFDIYSEYRIYLTTIENLHWSLYEKSVLNSCIVISIIPTIYYSILNIEPESLFKLLYSLLYSVSPLAIYYLSRQYITSILAFFASCFYMFTYNFLFTELHARSNMALLFVSIIFYLIFNDNISLIKRKILLIMFIISCILSHYSTSYLLFFILLCVFLFSKLTIENNAIQGKISLVLLIIFFAFIFAWYSQITEVAFNYGISFITNIIGKFSQFFIEDSRSESISCIMGKDLVLKGFPNWIEFFLTWIIMGLSAFGVFIAVIIHLSNIHLLNIRLPNIYLSTKQFDSGYLSIGIFSLSLLIIYTAFPFISKGYGIDRTYSFSCTSLSVFFVIGCMYFLKIIYNNISSKSEHLIICTILVLYLLCILGVIFLLCGLPKGIILNSYGNDYDLYRVYDNEIRSSIWLSGSSTLDTNNIFADTLGINIFLDFSKVNLLKIKDIFVADSNLSKYIYLRNSNINYYEFCYNSNRNKIYNNKKSAILS